MARNLALVGLQIPPLLQIAQLLHNPQNMFHSSPISFDESVQFFEELRSALKNHSVHFDPLLLEEYYNHYKNQGLNFGQLTPDISKTAFSNSTSALSLAKTPLLNLQNIIFQYPTSNSFSLNINFSAFPGEFIGLIGKNGVGKSTFLKLINGLLRPSKGSIFLQQKDIKNQSIAEIAHIVGYIFQNPSIQFYQETLEEEFKFVLSNFAVNFQKLDQLILPFLEQFHLIPYQKIYPRYLSIGEQQKAALAIVLMLKPTILLLDEPTHGMDSPQKNAFFSFLRSYSAQGNLVLMATHDIETLAEYANRIVILDQGSIIEDGIPSEILPKFPEFIPSLTKILKKTSFSSKSILNIPQLLEVLLNDGNSTK
jgi:energy-coupling factor transport system ATP-binding protein